MSVNMHHSLYIHIYIYIYMLYFTYMYVYLNIFWRLQPPTPRTTSLEAVLQNDFEFSKSHFGFIRLALVSGKKTLDSEQGRNDPNGAQLFIATPDRHQRRLNAWFMRFQCASMTASVLSTIATLWLPWSPLYTDFLGASNCMHQAIK